MLWGRINERTTMDLGLYPWRTIRHPGRGVLTPFRLSFGDLGVGPQNLWWSARFMFTNSKYLIFYLHKILYRLSNATCIRSLALGLVIGGKLEWVTDHVVCD